jgi:hypothetical protein
VHAGCARGAGCGAPRAVATPDRAGPRQLGPPPAPLVAERWNEQVLPSVGLVLPLPDAPGWSATEDPTLGFWAQHAATGLRAAGADLARSARITPEACMARARRCLAGAAGAW